MSATKEVGDAVLSIQTQARENIAAVESAASGIEESTQAAAASGRFMDAIVGIVESTATQVESIATASEEQSATSEEINLAVEEVNRIARETAEGMDVATAALSALTSLSNELDGVIRQMTGDTTPALQHVAPRSVHGVETKPASHSKSARPASPKSLPSSRPAAVKALPAARKKVAAHPAPAPKTPAPSKAASGAGVSAGVCSISGSILKWDDSLVVGVTEIDHQHQNLVRMICDLHEAMRSGKGKEQVESILRELEDYAVEHFGYEENLMEQYKYPGYLNHRKEHEAFVDKVLAFGKDFRENRAALTTEVMPSRLLYTTGQAKNV